MEQRDFINRYNNQNRPKFNKGFFVRTDDKLIEAMRHIIYSCERDNIFTIKVLEFQVIDDYDDVNHILWQYEESILNKGGKSTQDSSSKKRNKKKDNQFSYLNLKDSDLKVIRVLYYIKINEKKNGLVDDTVEVFIAIPRIINNFYYRINGNIYSAIYQIVDASTYNNSAAKNSKKRSVTFKTIFTPIRVYRYNGVLKDHNGDSIPTVYYIANALYKKSLLLIKFFLAKFGLGRTIDFLRLENVFVTDSLYNIDLNINYAFPVKDYYIIIPKIEFNNLYVAQSFVYTLHHCISNADNTDNVYDDDMYIKSLGLEFSIKDVEAAHIKGLYALGSLEFRYDEITKANLKLPEEDKGDVYRILRWMIYEYNALRAKDNLDISTKKVRDAEYIASYYASRLLIGIDRISDKGDRADLSTIRKAIQIPPMYLINAISNSPLVNYKDSVNDLDSLTALKYTFKGISGIGETSNAISNAYRSVHPSHLGRVDIDTSSNADPGISGTICPLTSLYDGHFIKYQEPSSWENNVYSIIDKYRSLVGKKYLYHIVKHINGNIDNEKDITKLNDSISAAKSLLSIPIQAILDEEYIDGYDIFGDGIMFWLRE